jgi:hypothetical protein
VCDPSLREERDAWASLPPLTLPPPAPRRLLARDGADTWGIEEDEQGGYLLEEWEEGEGDSGWPADASGLRAAAAGDSALHRKLADAPPKNPPKRNKKIRKVQGGTYDPMVMYYNQTHTAKNR